MTPTVLSSPNLRYSHVFHVADIHVTIDFNRTPEYSEVFDSFVYELSTHESTVKKESVVVIAGDVLHNKCKTSTDGAQLLFRWINRILDHAPVLVICGNHDFRQDSPEICDAIEMLVAPYSAVETANPLHYLKYTGKYVFGNLGIGVVSVKDTLRPNSTSGLVDELPGFPSPTGFNNVEATIALFHGTVCDSFIANGFRLNNSYPVSWFDGYDMIMLGDNHSQQVHGNWGYPGSLVQQNFGEKTFGHGYILWDVDTKTGTLHHIRNKRGKVSLVQTDMGWEVSFGEGFKNLKDNVSMIPENAHVRVVGSLPDAEREFRRHGLSGCVLKGYGLVKRSNDTSSRDSLDFSNDFNDPNSWIRFIREKWGDVDTGTQRFLCGDDLTVGDEIIVDEKGAVVANDSVTKCVDEFRNAEAAHTGRKGADVVIRKVEWSWLLCFGSSNVFDFRDKASCVVLLNGPNASGKSSFLDVLCIALYGETTPSRNDISGSSQNDCIVCKSKPFKEKAYATITLEVGGSTYTVSRSFKNRTDGGTGKKSSGATVCSEGFPVADGTVKTKQWVVENVGTMQSVLNGCLVQQMDNASFFYMKPTDRKTAIEKALGMDVLHKYEEALKKSVSAHSKQLSSAEMMLGEISTENDVVSTDKEEAELIEVEKRIDDLTEDLVLACRDLDPNMRVSKADAATSTEGLTAARRELESRVSMFEKVPVCTLREAEEWLSDAKRRVDDLKSDVGYLSSSSVHEIKDLLAEHEQIEPRKIDKSEIESLRSTVEEWNTDNLRWKGNDNVDKTLDTAKRTLTEQRRILDRLAEVSFLGSFCTSGDGIGGVDNSEAWNDYNEFVSIPKRSAIVGDIARYDEWIKQFPYNWTTKLATDCIVREERAKNSLKERLANLRAKAEVVEDSKPDVVVDINRLSELRDISYKNTFDPTVRDDILRELTEWDEFVSEYRDLPSVKVLTKEVNDAKKKLTEAEALEGKIEVLNSRLYELGDVEMNPSCEVCMSRNDCATKIRLSAELVDLLNEASGNGSVQEARKYLEDAEQRLACRKQLNEESCSMEIKRKDWECNEKIQKQKIENASELKILEKSASAEAASILVKLKESVRVIESAEEFISKHDDLLQAKESALSQVRREDLLEKLMGHGKKWLSEKFEAEKEYEEASEIIDSINRYKAGLQSAKALARRLDEDETALDVRSEWETRMTEIKLALRTAEKREELKRAEEETSLAEKARSAAKAKTELARVKHVLASRLKDALTGEMAAARDRQAKLSVEIGVARQKEAERRKTEDRASVLRTKRDALKKKTESLRRLQSRFCGDKDGSGYKEWLYTNRVIPMLESEVNDFIKCVDGFRLRIEIRKNDEMIFKVEDRGSATSIDHASGYQKFVIGLGMRLALSRIGVCGHGVKHMFIDEGFTACDADNMRKARLVLDNMMSRGCFECIVVMSHLEAVRDVVDKTVSVVRGNRAVSSIRC